MASFIVFFVFLIIQIPIFAVLGITGVTYLFTTSNTSLFESIPQNLFASTQSFSLLAIPLFILAGELMNYGGITTRLIRFAKTIVGHFRGGLAYVNIVTNALLASILGSSLAQTAMMSKVMVPEMEKEGYKREFSAATTAAAGVMGPIIPPSMTFIIYSVVAETSIGTMFIAGIIPGILLGISFVALIAIMGKSMDLPKAEREPFTEVIKSFFNVLPALLVPIVIIGGILGGIFTATESAAVASLIAFVAGFFFYKELKLKEIPQILISTSTTTAVVTIIIAMATLFGMALTFEQVPQLITEYMLTLTETRWVFYLLIIVFLLLVGMIMDGLAAMIILVPILTPVAISFDIDLIHFGVVFCLVGVIGTLTPPVGAGLFVTSSAAEVRYESLIKALMPFLICTIIILLLITYIPQLVMWLPSLTQ